MSGNSLLVIEDNVILSGAYEAEFQSEGFEVLMARNVDEALEFLGKKKPDLVVLDLILPGKDGLWLLKKIKGSSVWKDIPVVIASNLGDEEEIQKGLSLGASSYVIKSDVSMEELVQKVRTEIKKHTSAK